MIGINDDNLGARFPAISDTYDEALQDMIVKIATTTSFSQTIRQNGTYCFVSGPAYESKAESRFLRSIGGDAVGMSTVPEIIAAKHCGMKILGLSLITNKVVTTKSDTVHASHAEVLAAVEASGKNVEILVRQLAQDETFKAYLARLKGSNYTPSLRAHPAKANNAVSFSVSPALFLSVAVLTTAALALTFNSGKNRV